MKPFLLMKLGPALLFTLLAGAAPFAQEANPTETLDQLSGKAHDELARSTAELNALRDAIATEKLPLAQELTALEEQLGKLRKDYDKVTRTLDEGNLEVTRIKTEIKARQDELSYVGNILDEYARTFESKVHVCEMQAYGSAAELAKLAAENTTLSADERFGKQLEFVKVSMTRLFDAIGGARIPGVAVDLQGAVAEGQFTMIGPIALFRAATGLAGMVVPQAGSTRPLVRPLEGALQAGLESLTASGSGLAPIDTSRGGALKELVQKTNLIHIFKKGGPIMWPLLVASILALGAALERTLFLLNEFRKRDSRVVDRLFGDVERGDVAAAIRTGKDSKDYVARTLAYALEHKEQSLSNALMYAQAHEIKRFKRGIAILDTVITLAPLLGLLGTVTGMMGSFSLIGGDLGAPGAITGGIAEALIATAFGLGIAITGLLPFNFLNNKLEEVRHELETASNQLELLLQPRRDGLITSTPAPLASHGRAQDPHAQLVGAGRA
jgi:biopolymer transport protein ExbB